MKNISKKVFRFLVLPGVLDVAFLSFLFSFPSVYSDAVELFSDAFGVHFSSAPLVAVPLLYLHMLWGICYFIDCWWDFLSPLLSKGWSFFKRLFRR